MSSARVKQSAKSSSVVTARHEAAHAVVGVRLNLPLAYSSVRSEVIAEGGSEGGRCSYTKDKFLSVGYTALVEGSSEAWIKVLPDPEARERLEAMALQTAAGIAADAESDLKLGDVSHQEDLQALVQIAGALGIGISTEELAVREWMSRALQAAGVLLQRVDTGAAWDRVRVTLARKRYLTGAQVRRSGQ